MKDHELNIAWLDIETTGLDEVADFILEVGVVFTDTELNTLSTLSHVISPNKPVMFGKYFERMSPEVAQMHKDSGLLAALVKGVPIRFVEDVLVKRIKEYAPEGKIALAGSGVSHFDRRFLEIRMPRVTQLFTYWSYDVGVIRRFYEAVFQKEANIPVFTKRHRALNDAQIALDEARTFKTMFQDWGPTDD